MTENDYWLQLFNGDTGVVIASAPGEVTAAFERVEVSPTRLAAVQTVYAMTVHKAQGSQFDTAAVVLPDPSSPILTRELLYTAVTRARSELIVVASEEAIRAAVGRPVTGASGLRGLLGQPRAEPRVAPRRVGRRRRARHDLACPTISVACRARVIAV